MMLYRLPRPQGLAAPYTPERNAVTGNGSGDSRDKAERFREAALPYLDDLYTLARYLLHDPADAEDAVQECYLRALRYFDTFRGTEIKPWLFAILRNVCRGEFARRSRAMMQKLPPPFGRRSRRRRKLKCCTSGMPKQSAVSSRSFPIRFVRRSYCARSTTCRIARSRTSSACPLAR